MRRNPRAKVGVALLLMLGLTACADTSRHPSAESGKVTRTTATVGSSTSLLLQPPPTTSPQPPTNPTATLSVSTAALEVGQPITVSGNDCPAGYSASANLLPSTPSAYPAIFSTPFATGGDVIETSLLSNGVTRVTSGANATWTISTAVPMVVPGPSTHHCAVCATRLDDDIGIPLPTEGSLSQHALHALSGPWHDSRPGKHPDRAVRGRRLWTDRFAFHCVVRDGGHDPNCGVQLGSIRLGNGLAGKPRGSIRTDGWAVSAGSRLRLLPGCDLWLLRSVGNHH